MAWFKASRTSITGCCRRTCAWRLQIDVTATPRHNNGAIFVQTVSDYPLVEAIHQNVVKHPVLPDAASRAKLHERKSAIFTEKYADYLRSASRSGARATPSTKSWARRPCCS
jgi:type III restriction enzyme